jgi:hypothetical protein
MVTRTSHAAVVCAGLMVSCLAAATPRASINRPIFVCRGVPVIFSDHPCGPLAEARVLHFHDPGPGRASSVAQVPSKEATRPRTEPRTTDARPVATDDRCRRLREERERLDQRMRAGYPAREAAKLWNRWREVDAQIYADRC